MDFRAVFGAVLLLFIATAGAFLTAATNLVVVIGLGLMMQDATRESLWPVLEGWANRDAPSSDGTVGGLP